MEVAFVCESADCAAKLQRFVDYLYLVEVVDPEAPMYRADFSWVDAVWEYRAFEDIEECIRRYWAGVERAANSWEILIAGELVVRDRLTRLAEHRDFDG